jgi:membrane fusion protein, copper/silver efflux system
MKNVRSIFVFGALCAASFSFFPHGVVALAAAQAPETRQYRCPMHPAVHQDSEGSCPICGMKLVAVTPEAKSAKGAIAVTPDKQDLLGIAVSAVRRSASTRMVRVPGRVVPDETRLYRVNAGIEGSIRELAPVTTGSPVRKNQILGAFFAPSAMSAMSIYILNLAGHDRAVQQMNDGAPGEPVSAVNLNLKQRFVQLENMGVSRVQRDELQRTRVVPETIKIVSPTDGFVLARNVAPSLKFERGYEFFRIADLRRVWVMADVFPQDASYVRAGMPAQVSMREQGVTLRGTVTQVLPQFDAMSRTLKVRVEVDNPGFVLRPDMFVEVQLLAQLPEALTVPADAVVDTGLSRTVFVETAPAVFEPRKVETGFRNGDRIEIVGGLSEGERIATSGVFFLDSETRMRAPASGATASAGFAPDPTGHERTSSGGAGSSHHAKAQEAARSGAVGLR